MRPPTIALAAFLLIVPACGRHRADAEPDASKQPAKIPVRVVRAEMRSVPRTITLTATVQAGRRTEVIPEVEGIVATVFKREGDRVAAGEPLLAIADETFRLLVEQAHAELRRAEAGIAQAAAQLTQIRAGHRRTTTLREREILSPTEQESSEAALQVAEATLAGAHAAREAAAVAVRRAEKALRDTVLRAPFAGHVAKRLVDEGSLVHRMPPTPAMIVVETDPVKIEGGVGEHDAAAIRPGMPVAVEFDALPGRTLAGTLDMVGPTLDPVTRTATVRVVAANPGDLRPGMAARVRVDLGSVSGVAVAREAFAELAETTGRLFVIGPDRRAAARAVTVRERAGEWVILADGLAEHEPVVAVGHANLRDGMPVDIVEDRS